MCLDTKDFNVFGHHHITRSLGTFRGCAVEEHRVGLCKPAYLFNLLLSTCEIRFANRVLERAFNLTLHYVASAGDCSQWLIA